MGILPWFSLLFITKLVVKFCALFALHSISVSFCLHLFVVLLLSTKSLKKLFTSGLVNIGEKLLNIQQAVVTSPNVAPPFLSWEYRRSIEH